VVSIRTTVVLGACLVALGVGAVGCGGASSGNDNRAPRAGVPHYVSRCLAKPEAERGACFAAASRGHVPAFVSRCLAKPEAERGACFAAASRGHVPAFVSRCLAKPEAERGACFAAASRGH